MKTRDLSFRRAIAFASDLIRIPGPPGGEGDVAERLRAEMEALGFHDVEVDSLGNVIGRAPGTGSAPAVMLNSHLDVVDVGDPAGWEFPPFGGVIDGGFLHGRGAMDIKGPLALQTYAAARFLDDPAEGDVIVAHTVYEERGGWGMEHLLASGRVSPGAVIIGESTRGDICIGHRGRAEIIIEVKGLAGHASAPERARNPLAAFPALIPALQAFADSLGADSVLGRSTLAPTMVETLPRSRNVIPDVARIIVDWRVLPDVTPDAAAASLGAFLHEQLTLPDGCSLDVRFATERQTSFTGQEAERILFSPGFLIAPDHPVVRAAAEAVASATGTQPAVRPWTFATDGGHSCGQHGIPTIGYAPGEERFAHTNRERLPLREAEVAYDAHPGLIRAVMAALD